MFNKMNEQKIPFFNFFFEVQGGFSSERHAREALHLQVKADLNFQPFSILLLC